MEKQNLAIIIFGIITSILFVIISALIKDTEAIWIETRIFGLIAFVALFLTVLIGELRLLSQVKADFTLFRFHTPIAIFSLFIVFNHFVAAAFDNFKWGKGLVFTQYLGFTFTDKWFVYLSLGTLAFYLMILVSFTSHPKGIQLIRYKNWKLVHYLSYILFIIAYIHSINLGTDLKTEWVSVILRPLFLFMLSAVTAMLVIRVIKSFGAFEDQLEVNLASALALIIFLAAMIVISQNVSQDLKLQDATQKLNDSQATINQYSEQIAQLTTEQQQIQKIIQEAQNGQGT